jgi:hypothetical protein
VSGELAFSETMVFDYDRDGTPDRVQFWIEIEGRPALGTPGSPDARPEAGSVRYFVLDVERGRRIDDWLIGFNMDGGFPAAGEPYPITHIRITGREARFDLRGATWTILDGGDSWEEDSIEVRTGERVRPGRFYGGDVRVVPDPRLEGDPLDIPENRECIGCHREAAVTIARSGGPHREFECVYCHAEHPPEAEGAVPQCAECHDRHAKDMTDASCVDCHADHDVAVLRTRVGIPDPWCTVCHEEAAATLQASRSLHAGIGCVLCHQAEHGASQSCTHCHGKPHPRHVMDRPDLCAACHKTAHDLQSGRAR